MQAQSRGVAEDRGDARVQGRHPAVSKALHANGRGGGVTRSFSFSILFFFQFCGGSVGHAEERDQDAGVGQVEHISR